MVWRHVERLRMGRLVRRMHVLPWTDRHGPDAEMLGPLTAGRERNP
jgi:hypothetical protein